MKHLLLLFVFIAFSCKKEEVKPENEALTQDMDIVGVMFNASYPDSSVFQVTIKGDNCNTLMSGWYIYSSIDTFYVSTNAPYCGTYIIGGAVGFPAGVKNETIYLKNASHLLIDTWHK